MERAALEGTTLLDDDTINTSVNGNLQLNYNVFTGGSRGAQIRASETQGPFQPFGYRKALSNKLALTLPPIYYNLQNASGQVGYRTSSRERSQAEFARCGITGKSGA